ncbi:DNA-binding death effector domain-containing protein 2 isoform X1 [Alligator mississippiensis]|uniref:DNA-binding death effector domain-containing protein 2 isoform X1 n=1 Tax=Alligator mississippiensis TaxID=8496 RepID=UPI002877BDE8|nr:DNA-binding death effector domain-containing protein 2 isoform X1 [Alligator mississippiensis]XP_059574804.1 DNA-binding death effector domain-containing protein 2 isoform X1 [Alligator mississippiensis]
MAVRRRVAQPWEEEECLEYYGMLSLHRLFEVVGSQLSAADVAVLAFLLDETKPYPPSSPAGPETAPLEVLAPRRTPYNGVELLLELEHRGLCHEGNFRHLLELLRVLTRHDLLPYVTLKRPRTVSPERYTYGPAVSSAEHPVGSCLDAASADPRQDPWETGCVSGKRKRASRGRTLARRRAGAKHPATPPQDSPAPTKVTCGRCPGLAPSPSPLAGGGRPPGPRALLTPCSQGHAAPCPGLRAGLRAPHPTGWLPPTSAQPAQAPGRRRRHHRSCFADLGLSGVTHGSGLCPPVSPLLPRAGGCVLLLRGCCRCSLNPPFDFQVIKQKLPAQETLRLLCALPGPGSPR